MKTNKNTSKKRHFIASCTHHSYNIGNEGFILFYRLPDFIFFLTIIFSLARKYGIKLQKTVIMPNHYHDLAEWQSCHQMSEFHREVENMFARGYKHSKKRTLFRKPYGSAPKTYDKSRKTCMQYIDNNPVAGKLVEHAIDYRWNFLAYYTSDHPFSRPIDKMHRSNRMKRSMALVDNMRTENRPLNYGIQSLIFKDLSQQEQLQIIDYIISVYKEIDYEETIRLFGSMDNYLALLDVNTGNEYDIKENWEDFSNYRDMARIIKDLGIDNDTFNFENCTPQNLESIKELLRQGTSSTEDQIRRFLHIDIPKQQND